jgi:hypothetical protein
MPLTMRGRDTFTSSTTLFIRGLSPNVGGLDLFILGGGLPFNRSLTLNIKTDPAPIMTGIQPLVIMGSNPGVSATSSTMPLIMWAPPQPLPEDLNLFIKGSDSGTIPAVMNLVLTGGNPGTNGVMPLFLCNGAGSQTKAVKLYISGLGGTPGAVAIGDDMNLHIERGPYAGMTLVMQNNGATLEAPLFISGQPFSVAQSDLFIEGFGGTTTGQATLVIPNVKQPTPFNGQATLVIPKSTGLTTQLLRLYINGWTP